MDYKIKGVIFVYQNIIRMSTEKKIANLKKKVAKLTETLKEEISVISNKLDYHNGSRFSYNIDRIERFNEELQEFEIINHN